MAKIAPKNNNDKLMGVVVYLLMFLGIIGWIIDGIIYWTSRSKYTMLHAGQACLINLILLVLSFLMVFIFPTWVYFGIGIMGLITFVVIIVMTIAAAAGNGIQLGYVIRMVEKKPEKATSSQK